jgi:hypothetical protein
MIAITPVGSLPRGPTPVPHLPGRDKRVLSAAEEGQPRDAAEFGGLFAEIADRRIA